MIIMLKGEEYLDVVETAKVLGCSKQTVGIKARAKEMPLPIQLSSRVFWKKKEIDAYLEATRKKGE